MSKPARTLAIALSVAFAAGCASRPVAQPEPAAADQSRGGEAAAAVAKGAGKGLLVGGGACLVPAGVGAGAGGPIGFVVGGAMTLVCLPYGLVGGAVIGGLAGASNHHAAGHPHSAPSADATALPASATQPQCASIAQRDGSVLRGRYGNTVTSRFDSSCGAI